MAVDTAEAGHTGFLEEEAAAGTGTPPGGEHGLVVSEVHGEVQGQVHGGHVRLHLGTFSRVQIM